MAERPVTNAERSEFEGGGVMPNTVFPKGADALTASDKLRLQSITGQEDDPNAPVDPWFWQGNVAPEPVDLTALRARQQANRAIEQQRYRETPRANRSQY